MYCDEFNTIVCLQVIPGREKRATEALTWVGERLFSAGLNSEIVEYDLENHKVKYTLDAYGGPIWTIASNKQGTHLAVSSRVFLCFLCLWRQNENF